MGFLIDISDDAIANPCTSNIVKLSACQKQFDFDGSVFAGPTRSARF